DFVITSPPYMSSDDQEAALSNYQLKGSYQDYLKEIGSIFSKIKNILKPNKYLVIEVSNLKNLKITTLAWDIAKEITKIFTFKGETILCWRDPLKDINESYGYGYSHSYALLFCND
ncbi:MAG: DNA methyltransferase, partial [Candidatus Thorarchaeota archaeon]